MEAGVACCRVPAMAAPLIKRDRELDRIRWIDNVPFWGVHATAVIGLWYVGFSWLGIALCAASYFVRMFGITAGYHRYFSHRSYKTSRFGQVVLALLGVISTQKGPLWWAAHHRNHHKYSDEPEDLHSPRQRGFWWSHMFWILVERHKKADMSKIKDLTKYPELVFIDRFEILFTVAYAVVLYLGFGAVGLFYGYFLSTVILWHGTFTINSLAHVWGKRRYQTSDDSRNNVVLALLTGGEGWHNNHHHYQRAARQGFYWWEIDTTFYGLKALEAVRLVWDVQGVPRHVRDQLDAPGKARAEDDEAPAAAEVAA
jgi:stearoyl-CoA desaturase (delta-9 desaturase)